MTRGSIEAPCPVCRALVWQRRTGLLADHRANGVPCGGSGKRPPLLPKEARK